MPEAAGSGNPIAPPPVMPCHSRPKDGVASLASAAADWIARFRATTAGNLAKTRGPAASGSFARVVCLLPEVEEEKAKKKGAQGFD
jgi:hypothetical protein